MNFRDRSLADGSSFDKGLTLLRRIVLDDGATALSALAVELNIPSSTARRLAASLERHRLITRVGRGLYAAGRGMHEMGRMANANDLLARIARPALRRLARNFRATAHLGILEGEMVTYLVKEHTGAVASFTRERQQLEAYCSGMGKVLLAALDGPDLDQYLLCGDFVALTKHTITEEPALRVELATVARLGFAVDNQEVAEGLFCVAAPVLDAQGNVIAAVSISSETDPRRANVFEERLQALKTCASAISQRL